MADVALDPQNSNPKELYGQGVRAYVLQDYDTAVRAFSRASELLAVEHGSEIHDSLGDVYLYYGKSLLELSRKESGPLGEGVLKNVEEESDVDETESTDPEEEKDENKTEESKESEEKVNGDVGKAEEVKPEESAASSEENDEEKEEKTDEDQNNEAGSSSEKKEGEAEDELTDLQVAWEVLELAKKIFTKRGTDGEKNLAETLIVLGEVSLESGNFRSAVDDMEEGLKIQKTLYGDDSRTLAETYYKIGGAYSTNAQIDEAIRSFNASYKYLQNKVASLEKDEEHKEANAEEIEELNNLLPEIQEKVADMQNLKTEIANKQLTVSVDENAPKKNGTSDASSSKQVNDISHLVKRKRKEEDSTEENPAKKPSP